MVPELLGWVVFGAALGGLTQSLTNLACRRLGPEPASPPPDNLARKRIVILGGGFAGASAAVHLEQVFGSDRSVQLRLISETNALLFTPMLAEVAASSLEPTHIGTPLPTSLRRTDVIRGRIAEVDVDRRFLPLAPDPRGRRREYPFDHVVLALGSVSNFLGLHMSRPAALDFKTLLDAIRIRNRVIDVFERADQETDDATRVRSASICVQLSSAARATAAC